MLYDEKEGVPQVNHLIQYVLFFFSALFWLFGFALIGIGIYACVEKGANLTSISYMITDPAIIILCFGGGLFFITFFACVGALRQNVCMLNFFSLVICVSLGLQLISGFVGLALTPKVEKAVTKYLSLMIVTYRDDPDRQDIVDWGQEYFQCCGAYNHQDWEMNIYFNCSLSNPSREKCSVPWSCCKLENQTGVTNTFCGIGVMNLDIVDTNERIYTTGCIPAIVIWIHDHIFQITCLAFAVAVPQIVGILLARMLVIQIKDNAVYTNFYATRALATPPPVHQETEFFV